MNEKLYVMLGQKQERIEQLDAAYDHLLGLTAKLVSGDVARSRLLVNLTDRSWTLAPDGQTPGHPAQFNGLPVCVTAPPEGEPKAASSTITLTP